MTVSALKHSQFVLPHNRGEFSPPPDEGLLGGFAFALAAHTLLIAALAWGTAWNRSDPPRIIEAELWRNVVEAAAPKALETPPSPQEPVAQSMPDVEPKPAPTPPATPPDIAVQKDERLMRMQQKAEEAEARRKDALAKADAAKKAAEKSAREAEEKRLAQQREENLKRIAGLAGASGAPTATGVALQAAGPSAAYAARIRARIKPNIVFADSGSGNPSAEAEVRLSPDGTIVARRLLKSSGDKDWDEAVLRAIDRTEVLPRDENGRVPPVIVLGFRPRD